METYYLSLRPSSNNSLYRTHRETLKRITTGSLPTRGAIIFLAYKTNRQTIFNKIVDIVDKWDLSKVDEFVSEMTLEKVDDTILLTTRFSDSFRQAIAELLGEIRLKNVIPEAYLQTNFPPCCVLYKGNVNEEIANYLMEHYKGYNKREWIVTVNKGGSPPLFIKGRE